MRLLRKAVENSSILYMTKPANLKIGSILFLGPWSGQRFLTGQCLVRALRSEILNRRTKWTANTCWNFLWGCST